MARRRGSARRVERDREGGPSWRRAGFIDEGEPFAAQVRLAVKPLLALPQGLGTVLLLECPAPATKPSAQGTATDLHGTLGRQPDDHLVRDHLPVRLDHRNDERPVRVQARAQRPTLAPGSALAILPGARNAFRSRPQNP